MPELQLQQIVLLVCVGLFTLATAFCDYRARKVPNILTLPMFGIGWIYQLSFFGVGGLADAGLAFLLGFGMLFVLWIIGGGGGGDVKLMGALSVWLGYQMTLMVLMASTILVITGTMVMVVGSILLKGMWKTKEKYVAESSSKKKAGETIQDRKQRRIMAFAIPVALATWLVMFWKIPLI